MELENLNQEFPKMPEEMRAMIEREVEQQIKEGKTVMYRKRKHFARKTLVASVAAAMLLGTTVFAGVIYQMHNEKVGKYAVKTEIQGSGEGVSDTETTGAAESIPNVKMEVSYLPEGMVEAEKGKYCYEGSMYAGGVSVVFYRMDTGDEQFEMLTQEVVSFEEIKVGGYDGVCLETQGVTGGETFVNHRIYVAYTDVHYVMEMYASNDVPKEEAIKIAEGISLIPVADGEGDDIVNGYDWSEYIASLNEETDQVLYPNISVNTKNAHQIGEAFDIIGDDVVIPNGIEARVTEVQISDNTSLLDLSVINEDEKKNLAEEMDENGNFLPAKINYVKYGDGVNTMYEITDTREVPQKLVFVTVEYKNTTDQELTEVLFNGNISKLIESNGQAVRYNGEEPKEGDNWNVAEITGIARYQEMWYYDVHGGERHNNYISSIKPGETVTVHMAWLVPEEELGYLYLSLSPYGAERELVDIRQ